MKLLVGLGNPGMNYAHNRHNIGFLALNEIARSHKALPWRSRFQGETSEALISGEKVLLLKPMTFMNESGLSVQAACQFYRLEPGEVIIFHDELELDPGRLRVKLGGGNAGHNGLRSISTHIGNEYQRVRLGIGHPGDKALVHNYVLGDFAKADQPWVEDLCRACANHAALLLMGEAASFANKVHLAMATSRL